MNITKKTVYESQGERVIVEEADNYDGYWWRMIVGNNESEWYPSRAHLILHAGFVCLTSYYNDELHLVPHRIEPAKLIRVEEVNEPAGRPGDITKD